MPSFKSSTELRGRVYYGSRGLLEVRLWRGDTEIVVGEMVADDNGLDFKAVLNEEVPADQAPPIPADELAASLLTDEEKATIHQKAEKEQERLDALLGGDNSTGKKSGK